MNRDTQFRIQSLLAFWSAGQRCTQKTPGYEIETGRILKSRKLEYLIKACLQGGGGPEVVKVTRWGGVTSPVHIISYFNLITYVYMIDVDGYHIFLESFTSM